MKPQLKTCAGILTNWPKIQQELVAEYGENSGRLALAEILCLREMAIATFNARNELGFEKQPRITFVKKRMTR